MSVIRSDPQIMGGTPCFAGTRVPIRNLFDYIEGSQTIEEFLIDFPTVEREQVLAVVELASEKLISSVAAA